MARQSYHFEDMTSAFLIHLYFRECDTEAQPERPKRLALNKGPALEWGTKFETQVQITT